MIKAEIVAHSLSPQGDELISILCTFPRIILAEVNTHRMLSKNTSSSRAIPFNKMVESVQNNPFIPIAWQKDHKGMQGTEYWTDEKIEINNEGNNTLVVDYLNNGHLAMRDYVVALAKNQNTLGATKQICNRYLEPFMWTTMLITGPRSGWDNFFKLRCPFYEDNVVIVENNKTTSTIKIQAKSKKEFINKLPKNSMYSYKTLTDLDWLKLNKGQAEIHLMDLAEKIYDAVNESTPKQLKAGEWHIPFEDKISPDVTKWSNDISKQAELLGKNLTFEFVKVSVAMAARTSYTIVGNEKEINYEKMVGLHDRLLSQNPPHSSPLEHCARAMTDEEYVSFIKGVPDVIDYEKDEIAISYLKTYQDSPEAGWCNNFKGFIPYRYMVDNKIEV